MLIDPNEEESIPVAVIEYTPEELSDMRMFGLIEG
jgi:hypothetical protein